MQGVSATTVARSGLRNGAGQLCVNAFWRGDEVVYLHRNEKRELIKQQCPAPYVCYVKRSEFEAVAGGVRKSRYVRGYREEGEWIRIEWRDRNALKTATTPGGWFETRKVTTYESDLNPVRRWLTDNPIEIQRPRRCYIDLETDSRVSFSRKEEARILCWSLVDDEGNRLYGVLEDDTNQAEKELIEDLVTELMDYDQVLAWNLDGFDLPVLAARIDFHGVKIEIRRWLWLDQMELYRKMSMHSAESGDEKQSFALDAIAHALLGEGKQDFDASRTWEAWAAGGEKRAQLAEYNLNDADLLPRIEEKTGYAELLYTLGQATTTFPDSRGMNATGYVEGYLLKLGLTRGVHFRTKWEYVGAEQFEGAFVMEPTRREIMKSVHVADFAALYPSIIQTWNMSPESWRPGIKVDNSEEIASAPLYLRGTPFKEYPLPAGLCKAPTSKQVFAVEPLGLLPEAVTELVGMRSGWKKKKASFPPGTVEWKDADRRSNAYKIAVNSFYGVAGSPFSRFFERDIAQSVSMTGSWLIKETIKAAEARGWEVVYGDTDSLFVIGPTREEFGRFVEWCNLELYPKLLQACGCTRNEIKLGYEKEFERLVIVTAKRYAGRYAHYDGTDATEDSEPEVKGLEYKRGDTARLARVMQKSAIDLLMKGEENGDAFKEFVETWRGKVLKGELAPEDFVVTKKLSRPLRSYIRKQKKDGSLAKLPPHVEVAHKLAKRGADVTEGTRIQYVVVDGSKALGVIPLVDYQPGQEDRGYLWERLVYPPTMRLLQAAFGSLWGKEYLRAVPKVPPEQGKLALGEPEKPKPQRRGKPVPPEQGALALWGHASTPPDPEQTDPASS